MNDRSLQTLLSLARVSPSLGFCAGMTGGLGSPGLPAQAKPLRSVSLVLVGLAALLTLALPLAFALESLPAEPKPGIRVDLEPALRADGKITLQVHAPQSEGKLILLPPHRGVVFHRQGERGTCVLRGAGPWELNFEVLGQHEPQELSLEVCRAGAGVTWRRLGSSR